MKILFLSVFLFLSSVSLPAMEIGHAFHHENKDKLVIGKTTQADIDKYFGKPEKRFVTNLKSGKYDILEYYFIHSGFTDGDLKALFMELKDGILIAYVYDSSQGDDSTLFNHTEAKNIEVGHYINHVISKVGPPSGEALCPVNITTYSNKCVKSKHMKVWIYSPGTSMFGASEMETHIMFVGINDDGKILEISREVKLGGDL